MILASPCLMYLGREREVAVETLGNTWGAPFPLSWHIFTHMYGHTSLVWGKSWRMTAPLDSRVRNRRGERSWEKDGRAALPVHLGRFLGLSQRKLKSEWVSVLGMEIRIRRPLSWPVSWAHLVFGDQVLSVKINPWPSAYERYDGISEDLMIILRCEVLLSRGLLAFFLFPALPTLLELICSIYSSYNVLNTLMSSGLFWALNISGK